MLNIGINKNFRDDKKQYDEIVKKLMGEIRDNDSIDVKISRDTVTLLFNIALILNHKDSEKEELEKNFKMQQDKKNEYYSKYQKERRFNDYLINKLKESVLGGR